MTGRRSDSDWMRMALSLARRGEGKTSPNPPVGAVVAAGGRLVAAGYHRAAGSAHAEALALRAAGRRARGATLYVTLEPCSTRGRTGPCTEAILRSGIARVVAAVPDPNPRHRGRGFRLLRRAGLRVSVGTCAPEAENLLRPFAKWIRTGRPYVTLKMAMTLDGRIADASGRSRWISSARSRRIVLDLRRRVDAILVGRGTACADDPSLDPGRRGRGMPWRVVVDSRGRLPLTARLLTDGHADRTIIATTRKCPASRQAQYRARGAKVLALPESRRGVSMDGLFAALGRRGLLYVLCEGGGEMAHELVQRNLVDEVVLFVAPRALGSDGAVPVLKGRSWPLGSAPAFRVTACERSGPDVLLHLVPSAGRRNQRGGSRCSRDLSRE